MDQSDSKIIVNGSDSALQTSPPNWISDMCLYIEKHYFEKMSLEYFSKQCNFSKYHLQREFKRATGVSPTEYLLKIRLFFSKYYLQYSDSSINEISELCGFKSTSYFSHTFRKIEGVTPSKYRKNFEPHPFL